MRDIPDDPMVWTILDKWRESGDDSCLWELKGKRFTRNFIWRAWSTRNGVREWREEPMTVRFEIVDVIDDMLTLHRVLKNGKLSKAKDAPHEEDAGFMFLYRPSPLELLADVAEKEEIIQPGRE